MENALSRSAEESFKKFLDPDPERYDFQRLTSSFLDKDTSLVQLQLIADTTEREITTMTFPRQLKLYIWDTFVLETMCHGH